MSGIPVGMPLFVFLAWSAVVRSTSGGTSFATGCCRGRAFLSTQTAGDETGTTDVADDAADGCRTELDPGIFPRGRRGIRGADLLPYGVAARVDADLLIGPAIDADLVVGAFRGEYEAVAIGHRFIAILHRTDRGDPRRRNAAAHEDRQQQQTQGPREARRKLNHLGSPFLRTQGHPGSSLLI